MSDRGRALRKDSPGRQRPGLCCIGSDDSKSEFGQFRSVRIGQIGLVLPHRKHGGVAEHIAQAVNDEGLPTAKGGASSRRAAATSSRGPSSRCTTESPITTTTCWLIRPLQELLAGSPFCAAR